MGFKAAILHSTPPPLQSVIIRILEPTSSSHDCHINIIKNRKLKSRKMEHSQMSWCSVQVSWKCFTRATSY